MTDDEILTLIAEAAGFDMNPAECKDWKSKAVWCRSPKGELVIKFGTSFPKYLEDLNAMHEAEKTLTDHTGYWQQLEWIQGVPLKFTLLHATARQRAEAFLRTIGKWKD